MHLCPGRNFQFVFPLLHVNKLQCLLIVALHRRGGSVCPTPPTCLLHTASGWSHQAAALVWVSTSLFIKSRWWGCYVCTCKSFENMKSSKCNPECVLLEGFCPFPVWIGKYAARQNGLLSAKAAVLPAGLGQVIKFYTFDCQLGGNESAIYLHHEKSTFA